MLFFRSDEKRMSRTKHLYIQSIPIYKMANNKKCINVYFARADKQKNPEAYKIIEEIETLLEEVSGNSKRRISRNAFFQVVVYESLEISASSEVDRLKQLRDKVKEKLEDDEFVSHFEKRKRFFRNSKKQKINTLIEQQAEALHNEDYETAKELSEQILKINNDGKIEDL